MRPLARQGRGPVQSRLTGARLEAVVSAEAQREPVSHVPGPRLAVCSLAACLPTRRARAACVALAQRDVLGL